MHEYGMYKVLTSLFNEETSASYPLYIHKIELTTRICFYFHKSKGEFISVPKQNIMKLYREIGHMKLYPKYSGLAL
jgi:hypothetical protein